MRRSMLSIMLVTLVLAMAVNAGAWDRLYTNDCAMTHDAGTFGVRGNLVYFMGLGCYDADGEKVDYEGDEAMTMMRGLYRQILAVADAYKRLIAPAIEREMRRDLTEQADHLRERDALIIHGLREQNMREHVHSVVVLATDPLTGVLNRRAFTELALYGHTGDALQGFRDVLVGELADIFRGDAVHHHGGVALGIDGSSVSELAHL